MCRFLHTGRHIVHCAGLPLLVDNTNLTKVLGELSSVEVSIRIVVGIPDNPDATSLSQQLHPSWKVVMSRICLARFKKDVHHSSPLFLWHSSHFKTTLISAPAGAGCWVGCHVQCIGIFTTIWSGDGGVIPHLRDCEIHCHSLVSTLCLRHSGKCIERCLPVLHWSLFFHCLAGRRLHWSWWLSLSGEKPLLLKMVICLVNTPVSPEGAVTVRVTDIWPYTLEGYVWEDETPDDSSPIAQFQE